MAETVVRARLAALGDLVDYQVADGNPDIRGWDVYGNDNVRLGEARELIVDTEAMKARYLVIALDRSLAPEDRWVVVPVGRARLDDTLDRVYVDDVTAGTWSTLPVYTESFTRDQEAALFGAQPSGKDFYDRPQYATGRFFGKRRQRPDEAYVVLHEEKVNIGKRPVQAGEAVIHKTVETERVRETVPVFREEVTVERRPVAPGERVGGDVSVTDEEVRIPLMAEEATLNKEVVATEEIVVKKHRVEEQQVVETDVRRERADVDTPAGTRPKKEPV